MSTIDEIMRAIDLVADAAITWCEREFFNPQSDGGMREKTEHVREMIAAALADARREGVEAMREAAAAACNGAQPIGGRAWSAEQKSCFVALTHVADYIRALPLPTGERQAVLLTDEQIGDCATSFKPYPIELVQVPAEQIVAFVRAIETAVLAANNLEVRRG